MYIPPEAPESEKIIIRRADAGRLDGWVDEGIYDKVLVDAPCTTDRLAVNQDEGNLFSSALSQIRLDLPQLQVKLLVYVFVSLIFPFINFLQKCFEIIESWWISSLFNMFIVTHAE